MFKNYLLLTLSAFLLLLITGCSDQNQDSKKSAQTNLANADKNTAVQPAAKPNATVPPSQSLAKTLQEQHRLASRNEVKALTDESKADEEKIQQVIEQVNENLTDRATLNQADAKLKNILPEYKEKILQIAKAKLKETNQTK